MHRPPLRRHAALRMPQVPVHVVPGTDRTGVLAPLPSAGLVGIELGVAGGSFSARLVASGRFRRVFGVDAYAGRAGDRAYRNALTHIGLMEDFALLRLSFSEALKLFPDGFFDFVYCDGYAHTGEEGGRTLVDWYAKLRPGGVLAGDDYAPDQWPLVVWAVNDLVAQLGVRLMVTEKVSDEVYNRFPSWFFVKPEGGPTPEVSPELALLGEEEQARIAARRKAQQAARRDAARSARRAAEPAPAPGAQPAPKSDPKSDPESDPEPKADPNPPKANPPETNPAEANPPKAGPPQGG